MDAGRKKAIDPYHTDRIIELAAKIEAASNGMISFNEAVAQAASTLRQYSDTVKAQYDLFGDPELFDDDEPEISPSASPSPDYDDDSEACCSGSFSQSPSMSPSPSASPSPSHEDDDCVNCGAKPEAHRNTFCPDWMFPGNFMRDQHYVPRQGRWTPTAQRAASKPEKPETPRDRGRRKIILED